MRLHCFLHWLVLMDLYVTLWYENNPCLESKGGLVARRVCCYIWRQRDDLRALGYGRSGRSCSSKVIMASDNIFSLSFLLWPLAWIFNMNGLTWYVNVVPDFPPCKPHFPRSLPTPHMSGFLGFWVSKKYLIILNEIRFLIKYNFKSCTSFRFH